MAHWPNVKTFPVVNISMNSNIFCFSLPLSQTATHLYDASAVFWLLSVINIKLQQKTLVKAQLMSWDRCLYHFISHYPFMWLGMEAQSWFHAKWNWALILLLSYSGLLQSLLVLRVPPPQDREHSLYGPQGPHSPWTGCRSSGLLTQIPCLQYCV